MSSVTEEIVRLGNIALAEVAPEEYLVMTGGRSYMKGKHAYRAGLLATSRVDPGRDCVCPAHANSGHAAYYACAKVTALEALVGIRCWKAAS